MRMIPEWHCRLPRPSRPTRKQKSEPGRSVEADQGRGFSISRGQRQSAGLDERFIQYSLKNQARKRKNELQLSSSSCKCKGRHPRSIYQSKQVSGISPPSATLMLNDVPTLHRYLKLSICQPFHCCFFGIFFPSLSSVLSAAALSRSLFA